MVSKLLSEGSGPDRATGGAGGQAGRYTRRQGDWRAAEEGADWERGSWQEEGWQWRREEGEGSRPGCS